MNNFTVKDIIFLAILAAVTLLISAPLMMAVATTNIFALRNAAAALIYALAAYIALRRVPKMGTMTLFGLFTGGPLVFMSVIMLLNQLIGGFISDLIVKIAYGDYSSENAIFLGSFAFMPATLPVTFLTTYLIRGTNPMDIIGNVPVSLICIVLTFVLSYLGSKLGSKVTMELEKAGRL